MTLKMAVLAPMPRTRVRIATAVNVGCRRSDRNAYRTSPSRVPISSLFRLSVDRASALGGDVDVDGRQHVREQRPRAFVSQRRQRVCGAEPLPAARIGGRRLAGGLADEVLDPHVLR